MNATPNRVSEYQTLVNLFHWVRLEMEDIEQEYSEAVRRYMNHQETTPGEEER